MSKLEKITIQGFKSIKSLENFELRDLNILIGGNGSGKTNFIEFFRMLRAMMELPLPGLPSGSLKSYVANFGGASDLLYGGLKVTPQIFAQMMFGVNGYRFELAPTADDTFLINNEARIEPSENSPWTLMGNGNAAPLLLAEQNATKCLGFRTQGCEVYDAITSWQIYHFHDTSKTSPLRQYESVEDNAYLRFDGANIAPFLMRLKEEFPKNYLRIKRTISLVAPFFDDFLFKPTAAEKIRLLWTQKGSDYPMKPQHFSDGTLRFIALATALMQPNPPATLLIDEPELGLHPQAIALLAEMLRSAALDTQIIVSTQSPALVDCFTPEDVVVVKREDGASTFQRLNPADFTVWLEEYSLGDLWRKNIIDGGPTHE